MGTLKEEINALTEEGTTKIDDIRGAVAYTYVNHARISGSEKDIYIAFGEIIPTVELQPRIGVNMSVEYAKRFLESFTEVLSSIEKRRTEE